MLTAVHPTLSRRQLLLSGLCLPVLATTAACTGDPEEPPTDPDRVALETALDIEVDLYMVVGNLKGGGPDALTAFSAVEAHVQALDTALGQPPSTTFELAPVDSASPALSPSPSAQAFVSVDEAIRATDRAVNAHVRALRSASAEISPLVASIAASDAAVSAYLRGGEA
jgi:hypothetical protein